MNKSNYFWEQTPIVNSHDNSEPGGPETQNIDRNIISQQHSEQDVHRLEEKKKRGERGPTLGSQLDAINKTEGCKDWLAVRSKKTY